MRTEGKHFLNVQAGEWTYLLVFIAIAASNMISLEATYVVSTDGFLGELGANSFPLLWIVDMSLILIATAFYSLVIDRWPRKTLVEWMILALAILYLVIWALFTYGVPGRFLFPVLYLVAEQQLMLFPIAFWALGNDYYSVSQTKRLFPLIAAGSVTGGIIGNGLAISSATFFAERGVGSYELLVANALFLLASYLLLRIAGRDLNPSKRQAAHATARETLQEGWDFVRNVDAFRYLTLAMLGVGFALTIIEYHFFLMSQELQNFATFYPIFRIGQTVLTLIVQGLLASAIIKRIGLKNVFTVLPVVCGGMIGFAFALPGMVGAAGARLLARVFAYGLDEPARKSLQGLIPDERRGRVSAFLDGYLYAAGTIVASILLIILLGISSAGWLAPRITILVYLGVGLLIAAGAILSAWLLRKTYDTSMLNWRLARRRRRSSSIQLDL
jgi:AAA family ATP:ADP antiporter